MSEHYCDDRCEDHNPDDIWEGYDPEDIIDYVESIEHGRELFLAVEAEMSYSGLSALELEQVE